MCLLQRCSHTQSEGPNLSLIRSANWGPGREMPPIHWPGLPFRHLLNLKPHRLSKKLDDAHPSFGGYLLRVMRHGLIEQIFGPRDRSVNAQ